MRILSEAVKHFDLSQIYLRPVLRELLDASAEPELSEVSNHVARKVGEKPIDIEE